MKSPSRSSRPPKASDQIVNPKRTLPIAFLGSVLIAIVFTSSPIEPPKPGSAHCA